MSRITKSLYGRYSLNEGIEDDDELREEYKRIAQQHGFNLRGEGYDSLEFDKEYDVYYITVNVYGNNIRTDVYVYNNNESIDKLMFADIDKAFTWGENIVNTRLEGIQKIVDTVSDVCAKYGITDTELEELFDEYI